MSKLSTERAEGVVEAKRISMECEEVDESECVCTRAREFTKLILNY